MTELKMLEIELKLIQENIERVKEFKKDHEQRSYPQFTSRVFGELKHRLVALKGRISKINKQSTSNLFN